MYSCPAGFRKYSTKVKVQVYVPAFLSVGYSVPLKNIPEYSVP